MRLKYNQYSLSQGVRKIKTKTALVLSAVMLAVGSGGGLSLAVFGTSHAASDVVVSGNTSAGENQPGWMFNRDLSTSTPYSFEFGNASTGVGSLYVQPIDGSNANNKFIAENFYLSSADDFNSFSYDFKEAGTTNATSYKQFYLNVYANLPGQDVDNFYDCRFDFVPTSGSTSTFTTFTVDNATVATRVGSHVSGCPANLGGLPSGSTIRAFAINVGDTSTSDTGLAGYLDNVVVNDSNGVVTYDFEPVVAHGEITSPTAGQHVSGTLNLAATYQDNETTNPDGVQWAVREGTCAAGTSTVFGNVDGHSDEFTWTDNDFSSTLDVRNVTPGEYCFIFNPVDDPGQPNVRETQTFYIDQYYAQAKTDCKNGGWITLHDENDGSFKNQGQCVAYVNHNDQVGKDDDHARNR